MNQGLVSTAMLHAIWSKKHADAIDLLIPFAMYAIGKSTSINAPVSRTEVVDILNEEISYKSVPDHVVTLLFNRLSSQGVLKKQSRDTYFLKKNLSTSVDAFKKEKVLQKEKQTKVGIALADYLNQKVLRRKFDANSAQEILVGFFETEGISIERSIVDLEGLRKKDHVLHYHVAQFLLQENDHKSVIFDYIIEMVRGYFISTAIFSQPDNMNIERARFSNTIVYFDTKLMLNILNLQTEEEARATQQLFEMLRQQGARIACFSQTIDELKRIMTAYKNGLRYGRWGGRGSRMTLEGWDRKGISASDVDLYLMRLESKVQSMGIIIAPKPSVKTAETFPIDEIGLQNHLEAAISYSGPSASKHDVDCAVSICLLRNDYLSSEIEKCGHIFITQNIALVRECNSYLKDTYEGGVPPFYLETDLAAILWIKGYSSFGDYPKYKLIEHATLAMAPSEEVISVFYKNVDRMSSEGKIMPEEVAAIREGLFSMSSVMKMAEGDVASIDDDIVYRVCEELREGYGNRDAARIASLEDDLEDEARRNLQIKRNAADEVKDRYRKSYKHAQASIALTVAVAVSAAIVYLAYATFLAAMGQKPFNWFDAAVLVFSIYAIVDNLLGKLNFIKKFIGHIAEHYATYRADAKRAEMDRLLS